MTFTSKDVLKKEFETGVKPTGGNFANLIDSFVSTVNGVEPDASGNVDVDFAENFATAQDALVTRIEELEGQIATLENGIVTRDNAISTLQNEINELTTKKEYLSVLSNNNIVLSAVGERMVFNAMNFSNGITYDATNGEFTLKAGKVYKVSVVCNFEFAGTNKFIGLALYNSDGTKAGSQSAIFRAENSTVNDFGASSLDLLFVTSADVTYYVGVTTIDEGVTAKAKSGFTRLLIHEV